MPFCLPKTIADKFIKDLPRDINTLVEKTSAERRAIFSKSVGESNAKQVNALFESKLLLKNQQKGLINWVEKVANMKPEVKRDLISRVNRMTEALTPETKAMFLEDLVAKRLGFEVTVNEAGKIADLAKTVEAYKKRITDTMPDNHPVVIEYGMAAEKFQQYTAELKVRAKEKTVFETIKSPSELINEVGGSSKAVKSTFDNSFTGRQGLPVLATNPTIWAKTFLESWKIFGEALMGGNPIDGVRGAILGMKNTRNGKIKAGGYDLGVVGEEAFPKTKIIQGIERIPILGHLLKASEQAYNGAALLLRAKLANEYIRYGESRGANMLNPAEAKPLGEIANIMTGRGSLGRAEAAADLINVGVFSAKKLSADFGFFTKPITAKTKIAKQLAMKNLLINVGALASFIYITNIVRPGTIELDPRNANFGSMKIGNSRVDITGGKKSMVILASRLFPTQHKGEWGAWYQSSTSGKWTFLSEPKFGQMSRWDVMQSYFDGKLAPLAGVLRDRLKNTMFDGSEATAKELLKQNTLPLSVDTFRELQTTDGAGPLGLIILETLGFGVTTYGRK